MEQILYIYYTLYIYICDFPLPWFDYQSTGDSSWWSSATLRAWVYVDRTQNHVTWIGATLG